MPDNQIGYEYAGKGHRSRMKEETRAKNAAKPKEKSEHRRNRKPQPEEREQHGVTVSGIKRKIILYTIQLDSFFDVYERLDREGYGVASKVAVSNVRNSTLDVIKAMLAEGLITQEQLDQYRKRKAKEQKERFRRKGE